MPNLLSNGAGFALPDVWGWRASDLRGVGCSAAFFDPCLHFGQVPNNATRCQMEAAWELSALLHFVDRRVGHRNDLAKFRAPYGPPKG